MAEYKVNPQVLAENCYNFLESIVLKPEKHHDLLSLAPFVDKELYQYREALDEVQPNFRDTYVNHLLKLSRFCFYRDIAKEEFYYPDVFPMGDQIDIALNSWRSNRWPYVPATETGSEKRSKIEYAKTFRKVIPRELPGFEFSKEYSDRESTSFKKVIGKNLSIIIRMDRAFYGGSFTGDIGCSNPEFLFSWGRFFGRNIARFSFKTTDEFHGQVDAALGFLKVFLPHFERLIRDSLE